jgi:Ca2+-binding RTX toxin-like protein
MAFFNEMNRRPEMGRVYDEYLKMWNEVTGGTLFTHLSDVTRYDKWGSWGALEFWNQNSSPKYDALKNYSNTLNATGVMLSGDAGNNTLTGDTRSDTIVGAAGADTINGGDGKDYLHGGAGNDLINGNNGNDLLLGSSGNDTLTGGQGLDYFSFTNPNEGSDTITDFLVGGNEQIRLMTGGFAGLTAAPGSDGRLVTGLYGEGSTRQIAAMMARVAHNFQTGVAILAVRSGSSVQIFYDPNTGISNNESLLGTLQNINLNQVSISNFHLYTMGG